MNKHDEDQLARITEERDGYRELLSSIRHELGSVPWSFDTLQQIAQMMHANGFAFRELK